MGVVLKLAEDRAEDAAEAARAERDAEEAVGRLTRLVAADMAQVDAAIRARADSGVPMIPQLANHLIRAGGKRLRPMLCVAAAQLAGIDDADRPHAVLLAAAVEFIHTATLLHDDVVDGSALRRGKSSANIVWGNQASVLVGDFLFSRAFQLMVETGSLKVLEILSRASAIIAEGEVMQLAAAGNLDTTEDAYLKVIDAKTAALFAAACEVGGVIGGGADGADRAAALARYGRNFGVAFQLIDDALDYSGAQAKIGKSVGDDFREGKLTLPVALACRRGDAEERGFWKRVIEKKDQRADDLDHAVALMRRHRALEDTIARARQYGAAARDALAVFPESPVRKALVDIVDFCVNRGR